MSKTYAERIGAPAIRVLDLGDLRQMRKEQLITLALRLQRELTSAWQMNGSALHVIVELVQADRERRKEAEADE